MDKNREPTGSDVRRYFDRMERFSVRCRYQCGENETIWLQAEHLGNIDHWPLTTDQLPLNSIELYIPIYTEFYDLQGDARHRRWKRWNFVILSKNAIDKFRLQSRKSDCWTEKLLQATLCTKFNRSNFGRLFTQFSSAFPKSIVDDSNIFVEKSSLLFVWQFFSNVSMWMWMYWVHE